jgi:hypothetical protein
VEVKPKPTRAAKPAKTIAPKVSTPATVAATTAAVESESVKLESSIDTGLSAGERLKIQSALLWSGDYTGSINGDDPLISAIKNYQKRARSRITGVLSPVERSNLLAAAQSHEDEFGWTVVVDPATGVRIGLPMKLVPQARDTPRGTRWSAKHGEVQVETFRIKSAELKLAALFEQQKKDPSTRKIEQSVLRDDSFVITGMQGLKKFSVRAYSRNGEIRGVTVLFDQMMETIVAPVTAAMVSAFSPFPERTLPFAAPTKSVEYGTGLVVSARGHIVTDRKLAAGCQVIVAQADPACTFGRYRPEGRSDAGRHPRSERAERRQKAYRNQGAPCGEQRHRVATAGSDGRVFRCGRPRRTGSGSRNDGDAKFRTCQHRAGCTASAADHGGNNSHVSQRAQRAIRLDRRRRPVGGRTNYLRSQIITCFSTSARVFR